MPTSQHIPQTPDKEIGQNMLHSRHIIKALLQKLLFQ